jgi:hypothetical protein
MFPVKILGQDDWLIFGRTENGTLVYTVIETDWHWLEAPHKGQCWNDETGRNCCGDTLTACRIDSAYMLEWVKAHIRDYDWRECDYDTDGTYMGWPESDDEAFMFQSRKTYLPD